MQFRATIRARRCAVKFAGALKTTVRSAQAKVFLDFLVSPEAQQVMAKDGLLPAEMLKQ